MIEFKNILELRDIVRIRLFNSFTRKK